MDRILLLRGDGLNAMKDFIKEIETGISNFVENERKGYETNGTSYWFGRLCASEEIAKLIIKLIRD